MRVWPEAGDALASGRVFQKYGFERLDDADRAQAISDAFRGEALLRHGRGQAERVSALICIGCGEEIPEARQRAVVMEHCVDCARDLEQRVRKW